MRNLFLIVLFLLASGCVKKNCSQAFSKLEIEQCLEMVTNEAKKIHQGASLRTPENVLLNAHPYLYFTHSIYLLNENNIKEAAFWALAGQLRYSFYLRSYPELENSGEMVLFESLSNKLLSINPEFNSFMFSEESFEVTDRVLKWDSNTPNGFTSKKQFSESWNEAREHLKARKERLKLVENFK